MSMPQSAAMTHMSCLSTADFPDHSNEPFSKAHLNLNYDLPLTNENVLERPPSSRDHQLFTPRPKKNLLGKGMIKNSKLMQ